MTSILSASPGPQQRAKGALFHLRLATGFAGSVMASGFSWELGSGPLGLPPFRNASLQSIERWYAVRSSLEAALGFVRVAALATATVSALFFLVAFLSALLISRPERHLQEFGRRIAIILPRPFRRWRDMAAGLSLSTALVVAPLTGSFASTPTSTPTSISTSTPTTTASTSIVKSVVTSNVAPENSRREPLGPIGPIGPVDLLAKRTERTEQLGTKRQPLPSVQRIQLDPLSTGGERRAVGDPTSGQQWPDIGAPSVTTPAAAAPAAESQTSFIEPVPAPAPAERSTTTEAPRSPQRQPPPQKLVVPVPSDQQITAVAARHERHTVRAGESFWSIAEDVVLRGQPGATERDVNMYCAALIKANRAKLPDPANPDVVLVGTVLDLVDAPSLH
jgi:hypothetical protein